MLPKYIYVIIPAYNEKNALASTLEPIIRGGYSVVVVDDGSTDDTWQTIAKLPIHYIRHRFNLGQGAALQTGMVFALQKGAHIIVHTDADGQHDFTDVEALVGPIINNHADIVLGSRFLRIKDVLEIPLSRRLLLRLAVIVNGILTGVWLSDAHNGARALSAEAAKKISITENGFAHATEILFEIQRLKLRFVERPVKVIYTEYSLKKGQRLWNAINILFDLLLRRIFK